MPHIFGKLSTRAIIFFKIHFNRRFAQKVMGSQSGKSFNFRNFGTSGLGDPG
jgi:hypothetical protein